MIYSVLHKEKAITGFTLLILGTILWIISFPNEYDFGYTFLSIVLWNAGLLFIIWWFKKERSDKLRIGIIFAVIGQVTLWLFSEPIFGGKTSDIKIEYLILLIAVPWFISGLVFFSSKIRNYNAIRRMNKHPSLIREDFSDVVKEQVLFRQRHRCAICNRILSVVEFHHIDGNRSNNDISNCQALCPNCHAIKTRTRNLGI